MCEDPCGHAFSPTSAINETRLYIITITLKIEHDETMILFLLHNNRKITLWAKESIAQTQASMQDIIHRRGIKLTEKMCSRTF